MKYVRGKSRKDDVRCRTTVGVCECVCGFTKAQRTESSITIRYSSHVAKTKLVVSLNAG